jgi:glycosyltransferase involved in cell wall biosynthesis
MDNPTVSIVIPSYNHEKYVSETIESILNQTFQDFEIIITDDGSSDKTVEKIKQFSDPRINLYIFKENEGACKALNNSINNSNGKYIAYVSSDDVWEPDKLEKQVKFLDKNPRIAAVFTKVKVIDEESNDFTNEKHTYYSVFDQKNRSNAEWLRYFFLNGNCLCHPSVLLRRSVYNDVGLYNENMANIPDFEMWIRICLKQNIHILDEKLIKFRVRDKEANASSGRPENRIRTRFEYKILMDHYLKIDDIEFFLKIFPDAQKYGVPKNEMIPYFLGRIAYDTNVDFKQLWGLEIIYNVMQSSKIVDKLKKDYNFKYSDFLIMSSKADVFRIHKHPQKDSIIKQKTSIINNLEFRIQKMKYEIEYLNNKDRSITQRLISKFPSFYIILNRNNNSIKNILINIKGYKTIKKNGLIDIGYYLKNYRDVRLSGMDPLLHYLYHGFKEGKKPNPTFDGNYYLQRYNDVRSSNINPLVHYSLYGINEQRKTKKN